MESIYFLQKGVAILCSAFTVKYLVSLLEFQKRNSTLTTYLFYNLSQWDEGTCIHAQYGLINEQ